MSDSHRLKWSDFPRHEYERRVERAQRFMAEDQIDLLLLVQKENVEYFSGFQTGHWDSKTFPTAAVLLSQHAEPILIVPDFFVGNASAVSWLDEIHSYAEPHANPRRFGQLVVDLIKQHPYRTGTLGLEKGTHLTPNWNLEDYEYVTGQISSDIVSGASSIWRTRMVKSSAEIDRLRWLTEITEQSISAARKQLDIGISEQQVAAIVQREMLALGADGAAFRNIRAGRDRYACSDSLPQDRAIGPNEILLIDIGATYRTYATDVAYITHLGPALPARHREYDLVVQAQNAAIEALKPGALASDVFRAAHSILEKSELRALDMVGHGIGLDVHEPPMLTPYDDTELVPGMVFAVEPWLYDPDDLGLFCVEELIAVTEDGSLLLSTLARDELFELV